MLLTPSNTPEFSPVENLFGYVKSKLKDVDFINKNSVVEIVSKTMFNLEKS